MAALLAIAMAGNTAAQVAAGAFRGLGDLAGGDVASYAHGISADGSTVVGESSVEGNLHAFRWTAATGMVGLGALGGGAGASVATAVSSDGSVIVGQSTGVFEDGEAFWWSEVSGLVGLGVPAAAHASAAKAVSADGSVIVGWYSLAFDSHAFRWTAADGFVALNSSSGADPTSGASAVTPDGVVAGGFGGTAATAPFAEAMLWVNNTGAGLGVLSSFGGNSEVKALSADASIAVGWSQSDEGFAAFRWTVDDGISSLGSLTGGFSFNQANAVSADGEIVVGRAGTADGDAAFLWTAASGMVPLAQYLAGQGIDLAGWILTEATGISADGLVITGNGINPQGEIEAWVVNLRADSGGGNDPEPDECHRCRKRCHGHFAGTHRSWNRSHGNAEFRRARVAECRAEISRRRLCAERLMAIRENVRRRCVRPARRNDNRRRG